MSAKENPERLDTSQRNKNATIILVVLLSFSIILQMVLSTRRVFSAPNALSYYQVTETATSTSTETPTPTNTSTSTTTPTLAPVTLSFQNGVSPSNTYTGMVDTYISQADSFGNFGQSATLRANGGAADANYPLLKWDISQIPPGSTILSAVLTFNVITPTVDTYPIYELLKNWVFNQANWVNYAGGQPWESPGASGPTDRGAQALAGFSPTLSGQYSINLNRAVVQAWVDSPTTNNGFIIADAGGTVPVIFDSAEATTAANRPKLTIQFNWPPGVTPTPTTTLTPTSNPPAAPTNLTATAVTTTQVSLSWVDNSNNEEGFEIERSTDNVNWTRITTVDPNVHLYSDTGLTANTTYYYRVRAFAGTQFSAYSNVATVSTSPTQTPTVTVTGTPPTPTATGTIVPSITIVKSVSPSQASTGQLFNFTIKVTNDGLAAATSSYLTDTLPTVLTITGASTTRGTYSISSNTITFTIGTISPGQTVTLGILAQVNSTATGNVNYTNSATLSYVSISTSQSKTSNSVSFRVLGTGTLPGTGFTEMKSDGGPSGIFIVTLSLAGLLVILGLAALIIGKKYKDHLSTWSSWLNRIGIILIVAAAVFALGSWGLSLPANSSNQSAIPVSTNTNSSLTQYRGDGDLSFEYSFITPTPDKLPDYPIPTPSVQTAPGEEKPDTSPVEHIQIPAIGLDTVVKFVPFDGFSWSIGGLKQEIAWLGDTSWPGLGKNTGLAGHVTLIDGSNGPFRYLSDLRFGDTVTIYTQENIYTYIVREQNVVEDSDLTVLKPSDKSELTLITCTNWDKDLKLYLNRLVVVADLNKVEPVKAASLGN